MPLFRRKRVALVSLPSYEREESDQPCWMIRFTGEVFRSYDDYLARYQFYRKPVWQCEHTGRQNLTYEEALASEQRSRQEIEERLPSHGLRRAVLKMVQFQTSRIDALVDEAFNKLQHRFFVDEPLNYQADDGLPYAVRVTQVLPRRPRTSLQHILNDVPMPSPPPDELDMADASEVEYRVCMIDVLSRHPTEMIVEGGFLSRNRQTFTKQLLRQFIREAAVKDNYANAPWIVKSEIAHIYNISSQLPKELEIQREEAAKKRTKKRLPPALQTPEERMEHRFVPEKRSIEDNHTVVDKRIKAPEEKVKYPIEDLLLVGSAQPTSELTINVESVWFHDLFEIWGFLSTFCVPLNLTAFSLHDFRQSILHSTIYPTCNMTAASYAALLHCAAEDREELRARMEGSDEENADSDGSGESESESESEKEEEEEYNGKKPTTRPNTRKKTISNNKKESSDDKERMSVDEPLDDPLDDLILHKKSLQWWQSAKDETHWEARLLGCMHELANEESLPGYTVIVQHLTSIGTSCEDLAENYVTLKPEQKLAIYRWLVDLIVDGTVIRNGMDTASEKVAELRKERVDVSRELKKIVAQRLEVNLNAGTDSDATSTNGDREGTPISISHDTAHESDDASSGLTARQAKLRVKNLEREIKEAQRQKEFDKAREEQRARRKLDDEERTLYRKRDKLDRDISRCLAVRATPLGYDRWYRRYWFINSIAGYPDANTGERLYIQPPMDDECELLENSSSYLKALWHHMWTTQHADRWLYINQPEQLDQLRAGLDTRGEREMHLRRVLDKHRDTIIEKMETFQQLQQEDQKQIVPPDNTRRSMRHRNHTTTATQEPYLQYVNHGPEKI